MDWDDSPSVETNSSEAAGKEVGEDRNLKENFVSFWKLDF